MSSSEKTPNTSNVFKTPERPKKTIILPPPPKKRRVEKKDCSYCSGCRYCNDKIQFNLNDE